VYYVAEELNLDITRSWYMMGPYVWVYELDMPRIYHISERQIVPSLTPRETIEKLAFGPFRQFYEQARSSAKVLFDKIFRKNTEELRRSL
jgi:hypothetical protein